MIASAHHPYTAEPAALEPTGCSEGTFPRTSVRVRPTNPNHHLWNNNGTWYLHYTVHPTPLTKSRVRVSLETKSLDAARAKRDAFFAGANQHQQP